MCKVKLDLLCIICVVLVDDFVCQLHECVNIILLMCMHIIIYTNHLISVCISIHVYMNEGVFIISVLQQ